MASSDGAGESVRFVLNPDAIDCPLGDGLAVFDSRNGVYFNLNRTAALIWNKARTPATRMDLRAELQRASAQLPSPGDLDRDLDALIGDLVSACLVTTIPETVATASTGVDA